MPQSMRPTRLRANMGSPNESAKLFCDWRQGLFCGCRSCRFAFRALKALKRVLGRVGGGYSPEQCNHSLRILIDNHQICSNATERPRAALFPISDLIHGEAEVRCEVLLRQVKLV